MRKILGFLVVFAMLFISCENVYAGQNGEEIDLLEMSYSIIHADGTIEQINSNGRLHASYPIVEPGATIVWQFVPLHKGYNFYSVAWDAKTDFRIEVRPNLYSEIKIHETTIKNKDGHSGNFYQNQEGSVTFEVFNTSSSIRTLKSAMFNGT